MLMDQPGKRRALQPLSENVQDPIPERSAKRRASGATKEVGQIASKAVAGAVNKRGRRSSSGTSARPPSPAGAVATTAARAAPAFGRSLAAGAKSSGPSILLGGSSSILGSQGHRPVTRRSSLLAAQQHQAGEGPAAPTAAAPQPRATAPKPQRQTPTSASRATRSSASQQRAQAQPATAASPPRAPATSPLHVPSSYAKRRLSAARKPQNMDKLQSEYEALQQKLALLKRESHRGGGEPRPLQQAQHAQATPLSTAPSAVKKTPLSSTAHAAPENRAPAGGSGSGGAAPTASAGCASEGGWQLQGGAADAAAALQHIKFRDRHGGSALCAAAATVFEEEEFVKLCEQAMGAQLQRTKEGATAQSRILELAGERAGFPRDFMPVLKIGCHQCAWGSVPPSRPCPAGGCLGKSEDSLIPVALCSASFTASSAASPFASQQTYTSVTQPAAAALIECSIQAWSSCCDAACGTRW